ncbi:MAG: hypothetical protein ACREDF_01545, partial [Thermoplasmata archaeon]
MAGARDSNVNSAPLTRVGLDAPEHGLVKLEDGRQTDGSGPSDEKFLERSGVLYSFQNIVERTVRNTSLLEQDPLNISPAEAIALDCVCAPGVESTCPLPNAVRN